MMSVRVWLALMCVRMAARLVSVSRRLAPCDAETVPEGPSDYADPGPANTTGMDDAFWRRHHIIRHPGGVVSVASMDVQDDSEGENN